MTALHDDLSGAAGVLNGRIAPTGQAWVDTNDTCRLDGSGRFIRNATSEGGTDGSYGLVALDLPVKHMYADVSFTGTSTVITENGAIVLISGASSVRDGVAPHQGIFHNAVHAIFGLWQAAISIWENGASVQPNLVSYTYPGGPLLADGTIYRIGMYLDGQRLGLTMPDGTTKWAADPRVATYTGANLIYQSYNVTAPNLRPRVEEVWAETTATSFGVQGGRELVY